MSDLISRQAVLKEIDKACRKYPNSFYNGLSIAADIVAKQPKEERPKGKWIATHERGLFSHPDSITYVCSECGKKIYTVYGFPQVTKFCNNCGAEMEMKEC